MSEQIIKLWKKEGFDFGQNDLYIYLNHEKYGINLFIDKNRKVYHIFTGYINLKLNKLLTKTLMVLDKEI